MSLLDWTKTLRDRRSVLLSTIVFIALISSCTNLTGEAEKSNIRINSKNLGSRGAFIYPANPIILSNNFNQSSPNWGDLLVPELITENNFLTKRCDYSDSTGSFTTQENCIEVRKDRGVDDSILLLRTEDTWDYPQDSENFYQVNTYYHVNLIQNRFYESLQFAHDIVHAGSGFSITAPPSLPYRIGANRSFWSSDSNSFEDTLTVYSRCFLDDLNAFFDPSRNEICLGWNEDQIPNFRMAQDPSVIYHEMGHVFVKLMMNIRNHHFEGGVLTRTDFQSDLGSLSYDEAGSLNEGIADYFSYYINGRDRIGEWGIGRHFNLDRPLSEENILHEGRIPAKLRYPEFLHYTAQAPTDAVEDIHNAGQIVSHYLVSLTKEFRTSCSALNNLSDDESHKGATNYVIMLLAETLAEVGDMTATGSDFTSPYTFFTNPGDTAFQDLTKIFFTNMNDNESYLWAQQVTPPNFRRFFKLFGKHIKDRISNNLCPAFSVDDSEVLLDQYGLLLFKSYEDTGTGINQTNPSNPVIPYINVDNSSLNTFPVFNASPVSTSVQESNRNNTILISKTLVDLPVDRPTAFVVDTQNSIKSFIQSRTFEGNPVNITEDLASPDFNNGNVQISPGEVVAISLNLLNQSNSTMAGVQVLANDWDHMQLADSTKNYVNRASNIQSHSADIADWRPCQVDGWPLATEGGVEFVANDNFATQTPGGCDFPTRTNRILDPTSIAPPIGSEEPRYELDSPQPVCLVQFSDTNETRWVSQDAFRSNLGLSDNECLNHNSSGSGASNEFNPNECLIRFLPGANQSVLGKIDPQKTWTETLAANSDDGQGQLLPSAFMLMEVNKWIQPGTTFNCRLRTRFTNCQDCFTKSDGSEYTDFEYTSHEPFKVINFSFTVID